MLHLKRYDFPEGRWDIIYKCSESLALLRKGLVMEPWETQILEGCPWMCVDVCVCAHGKWFSGLLT